jgi:hypothetical protein
MINAREKIIAKIIKKIISKKWQCEPFEEDEE